MASDEPVALILIFSGHPGDKSHSGIKGGKRPLLSSVRHRVDLTVCSLSLQGSFLLFPSKKLSTESFPHSHFHLFLAGHSAIHLEEENKSISRVSPSPRTPFHIGAESDLFVRVVVLPV